MEKPKENTNIVTTINMGEMKYAEPFTFLRGEENEGELMGQAVNEKGEYYNIYVSRCDLETCCCAAVAVKQTKT